MKCDSADVILDSLDIGIIILDKDLKISFWNNWLECHTSISRKDITGKKLEDFFQDLEIPILKRKILTALTLKSTTFYEPLNKKYFLPIPLDRLLNTDLKYMYQKSTISPYSEEEVIISIYDQSDLYVTNNRLKDEILNVKQLNTELEQDKEIIDKNLMFLKTELDGTIVEVSKALQNFYGLTEEELIGKNPSIFRHPDMATAHFKTLWETLKQGKTWRGEVKNKSKSGTEHWVDSIVSPFFNENEDIVYYTAIYHDITDKKRIEEFSKIDPLTKTYNRGHFDTIYEKEFTHKRQDRDLTFIILDIDHFKNVNDTYGHKIGDIILIEFADKIKDTIRAEDMLFRIGGEEFVLLLPHTNIENGIKTAEKIRKAIEDNDFTSVGKITCTIGVAQMTQDDTKASLYERADKNLYKAKKEGRNRVIA